MRKRWAMEEERGKEKRDAPLMKIYLTKKEELCWVYELYDKSCGIRHWLILRVGDTPWART